MARLNRKFKRHIKNKKHVYIRAILSVFLVVAAIWVLQVMLEKEGEHDVVVERLSGTDDGRYQKAIEKIEEGDVDAARVIMLRLARMGESADKPLGHGKGHLWVGEDILGNFQTGFIWKFPTDPEASGGDVDLNESEDVLRAQGHLEHALVLNPELEKAHLLLAATYSAQKKRNKAVDVLLNAVSNSEHPQLRLHVPLANVLTMEGEKLALEESAWHLFSSLGQNVSSGRERDVSVRVRYVLSALILKKYDNADIAIRRLEAQYAGKNKNVDKEKFLAVSALRMAYHYHRAVDRFIKAESNPSEGYQEVIDELARVLKIQPDCESAVEALSYIASKVPSQKENIQKILKEALSSKEEIQPDVQSKLSLAVAMIADKEGVTRKNYLEKALEEDRNNGGALLALVELLAAENKPDYVRIKKLAIEALPYCRPDQLPECYRVLGLANLRMENWTEAIVALERALVNLSDKEELHGLLEEAYQAVGQAKIAAGHRDFSKK